LILTQKSKIESVWIFKKLKIIKDFFFWDRLQKKNMFFMERTANQAVIPPGGRQDKKTSKDRSYWGLF
jgi:hypothetical protein